MPVKKLSMIFAVFLILGAFVGILLTRISEKTQNDLIKQETVRSAEKQVSYTGVISYVDPNFNPGENISFVLLDESGTEVMLLKANDQKLEVSEGLKVEVFGKKGVLDSGKEYLQVEKVIIKNAAN